MIQYVSFKIRSLRTHGFPAAQRRVLDVLVELVVIVGLPVVGEDRAPDPKAADNWSKLAAVIRSFGFAFALDLLTCEMKS